VLDFSFTPGQERLRQMLSAFALRELLPQYARWDRLRQYPISRQLLGREFAPET